MTEPDLEKRVTNLELALQAMWTMLEDLQPPHTQDAVHQLMLEHFEASHSLGGFRAEPGRFHAKEEDNPGTQTKRSAKHSDGWTTSSTPSTRRGGDD